MLYYQTLPHGTCGPDEKEDAKKSKFARTYLYIPYYRWEIYHQNQKELLEQGHATKTFQSICSIQYNTALTTASKNPAASRVHGNADDLYSLGIVLLEFMMCQSIQTLDPSRDYHRNYKLFDILE